MSIINNLPCSSRIPIATKNKKGLMSDTDKAKLDNIETNANNYIHPNDANTRHVTDVQIAKWNTVPTKATIGLNNVTNDAQVKRSEMGVANGVATLDEAGTIPSSQLPGSVDEIIEADTFDELPKTGESSKIYVTIDDGLVYRWSGTSYTEISKSLALGETSSTAYAGNKGKALADEVDKIKSGDTIVPKASNAATVNGFNVLTDVPANAKFTDTTYPASSNTANGLMSKDDKIKLDAIEANANKYVHPNDANTRHVTDTEKSTWNGKLGKPVLAYTGSILSMNATTFDVSTGNIYTAIKNGTLTLANSTKALVKVYFYNVENSTCIGYTDFIMSNTEFDQNQVVTLYNGISLDFVKMTCTGTPGSAFQINFDSVTENYLSRVKVVIELLP